jgi:putative MATE family efflux protein
MSAAPAPAPAPKFTHGSTLRHVVVMTATGSVGLMAIFIVDFLNLFYIALLGQAELAAAIGYAGTLLFFTVSLCIGISISGTALVSRALGARRRGEARRLATSSLVFMAAVTLVLTLATLPLLSPLLTLFGATGRAHEIAWRFLLIVMPTTPLMGLGMACAGLLRAVGDAKRAMYVTLSGGLITAVFDPLLIFGLELGVDGAAITSIFARLGLIAIGFNGCVRIHNLLARPDVRAAIADARSLSGIAVPAVLANIATPFGNAIVTAAVARYGDSAVAGYAVIGRIIPLAFGAIFALAGSIGPILGQNLGAERYDRVRRTLLDGMTFTTVYCIAMCLVLVVLRESIVKVFGATGEGAELIRFFCIYIAPSWIVVGWLFVANAGFNNLGFPTWSTVFNWGRATVGTIPFVYFGATQFGAAGVLAGQALGAVAFGVSAAVVCFMVVGKLGARRTTSLRDEIPVSAPPTPPFSSGKAATAIDWTDSHNDVKRP